jgi:hypothetical protein
VHNDYKKIATKKIHAKTCILLSGLPAFKELWTRVMVFSPGVVATFLPDVNILNNIII